MRAGAGVDGSDRVTIIFPDGAVKKTWLQVTVKATAATGLATPDVHYWGNAVGDVGNSPTDTAVNVADQLGARAHPHTLLTPAPLNDAYDFNRDKQVNVQDELIARSNPSTLLTDLNLIDLTNYGEGEGEAGSGRLEAVEVVALFNPSGLQLITSQPRSASSQHPASYLSSEAVEAADQPLQVGGLEDADQRDARARRSRWTAEHQFKDKRHAHDVALDRAVSGMGAQVG